MAKYSIKEVEHLSGVKAHTLRIWEQRYAILSPERTDTNIRYYSDEDLKLILNIALLNKQGHRIGTIAKMNLAEIKSNVKLLADSDLRFELQINSLTTSMIEIDEDGFEKIMSTSILQLGFEDTMIKIIYPFLDKIGIMWMTGNLNPAQEHFITNLIRQKIIVAIDGQIVRPTDETKSFLLFLPEGEMHELSLLFLTYMLKARNNKVIYLGANVPLNDVISVSKHNDPNFVYTILTSTATSNSYIEKYINKLSTNLANKSIILSGIRANNLRFQLPSNVSVLKQMQDVFSFIENPEASIKTLIENSGVSPNLSANL